MPVLAKNCLVEVVRHQGHVHLAVGDDLRMDGLDAPARIDRRAEAQALIDWLRQHLFVLKD